MKMKVFSMIAALLMSATALTAYAAPGDVYICIEGRGGSVKCYIVR